MRFFSLPILLVFSIKSTFATPVGDDSTLDQYDATPILNPVNIEQSTNQPSPNNDYPQSTSQLLATKLNPDTSFLEQTEDFMETPQQPYGDSSANIQTNKSPFASPPSQRPAVSILPDIDFQSLPVSPSRDVVPEKVSFRQPKPQCPPPWWLYCCFGDENRDRLGNKIVRGCFPCKSHLSFFFVFTPQLSKFGHSRKILIRSWGHRDWVLLTIRRERLLLLRL